MREMNLQEGLLYKSSGSPTTQELTIPGLLAVLRRRRSSIIFTTLFFVSIAALLCIFMTRKYKATGEIQVAKQSSDELGLDRMKSDGESRADALEENIVLQTQAEILQSDTLALKVIRNLDLEDTWDFQPRFSPVGWVLGLVSPKGPKDPVHASLEDAPVRRTRVLKVFAGHLKVKPVPGTQLIEISYVSSSPRIAAAVINQMMKGLLDYTFQTRYNATTEASQWLAGQMDDLKKQAEVLQAKVVRLNARPGCTAWARRTHLEKSWPIALPWIGCSNPPKLWPRRLQTAFLKAAFMSWSGMAILTRFLDWPAPPFPANPKATTTLLVSSRPSAVKRPRLSRSWLPIHRSMVQRIQSWRTRRPLLPAPMPPCNRKSSGSESAQKVIITRL